MKKAVAIVVWWGNKILVGKKKEKAEGQLSGKWHIPGETLEVGENDKQAAKRGIEEEAGIKISLGKFLGKHYTVKGTRVNWYEAEAVTTDIKAGSDLEKVRWVDLKYIQENEELKLCMELWPERVKKRLRVI